MHVIRLHHLLWMLSILFFPCIPAAAQEEPYEEILRANIIEISDIGDASGMDAVLQKIRLRLLTGKHAGMEIVIEETVRKHWIMQEGNTVIVRKLIPNKTDISVCSGKSFDEAQESW